MSATQRYSDEDCFRILRRHARRGRVAKDAYDARRDRTMEPSGARLIQRFGSWNEAVRLAGLDPLPPGRNLTAMHRRNRSLRYSEDDCIEALLTVRSEVVAPGPLRYLAYDEAVAGRDLPSGTTVRARLGGTWRSALARAGLPSQGPGGST